MKFTKISALLLSILIVSVASRQLLDADMDTALEHQRILAELEEVHQLRERMLQQGQAFCASGGHLPGCCAQLCLQAPVHQHPPACRDVSQDVDTMPLDICLPGGKSLKAN